MWQLGSSSPNFTLEGHEKGVNCIDYYSGGDKPYLISGADDRLVKIWDYQVQLFHSLLALCYMYVSLFLTGQFELGLLNSVLSIIIRHQELHLNCGLRIPHENNNKCLLRV